MHQHNFAEEPPYTSTFDALTKFPERCTAVAARMNQGKLELMAPLAGRIFAVFGCVQHRILPKMNSILRFIDNAR